MQYCTVKSNLINTFVVTTKKRVSFFLSYFLFLFSFLQFKFKKSCVIVFLQYFFNRLIKKMKYVKIDVPDDSLVWEKIQKIREKTGINNNKNAVIFAILQWSEEEEDDRNK